MQKGFTLIEMLVVIAVIGIIALVVMPSFSTMRQRAVLKSATSDVLSALDKARSQTLASVNSSEYGVHFQSDKVVIFKGTVYSAVDANNENILIASPATISTITLSGGGSDVYFNRLTGAPNKTGTVVVSVSSVTKTVTINATGAASMN